MASILVTTEIRGLSEAFRPAARTMNISAERSRYMMILLELSNEPKTRSAALL